MKQNSTALLDQSERKANHMTNSNSTTFLGKEICWYRDGLGYEPEPLALSPKATELDVSAMSLDALSTASRRAQRQYESMRSRLETVSDKWSGVIRHVHDFAGLILPQVLIEKTDSVAAAIVTSNENGTPITHINIAVPYESIELPLQLPEIAVRSLQPNQIDAIRRRVDMSIEDSIAFTIAVGPRTRGWTYPLVTYSLDRLLVREMLHWMWRSASQTKNRPTGATVEGPGWAHQVSLIQ